MGSFAMPFKSASQRRMMFARNPTLAEEFAKKTPKGKKLPERVHPAIGSAKAAWNKAHGKRK